MDCTSLFLQEKLDPPSMIFQKSQPPLNKGGEGGGGVLTNITRLVVSATSATGGYLVFCVIRKLVC